MTFPDVQIWTCKLPASEVWWTSFHNHPSSWVPPWLISPPTCQPRRWVSKFASGAQLLLCATCATWWKNSWKSGSILISGSMSEECRNGRSCRAAATERTEKEQNEDARTPICSLVRSMSKGARQNSSIECRAVIRSAEQEYLGCWRSRARVRTTLIFDGRRKDIKYRIRAYVQNK